MAIECYESDCEHHSKDEPFCHETDCRRAYKFIKVPNDILDSDNDKVILAAGSYKARVIQHDMVEGDVFVIDGMELCLEEDEYEVIDACNC